MLARFRPNDIIADVEAADVPPDYWTAGSNIQFRNNKAERVLGYAEVFDPPSGGVQHVIPNLTATAAYWVYASGTNVYVTNGIAHFDITPSPAPAPTAQDPWTSDVLNGLVVLTAGTGTPWYWDNQTGNAMQALPGWQSGHTCRVIRAYKNYLLALAYFDGTTFIPDRFAWSDAAPPGAVPTTWTPAATNDAGDLTLSDSPGEILDGQTLRDQFIIYAKNAVYALNFIGGNSIFSQRKLFSTVGILAHNCAIEVRGRHYVLTENDIIVHDGNQAQSLVDRRWRQTLFGRLESSKAELSFVVHYEAANEVWFCIPLQGAEYPNAALVYNYNEERLGWREFGEVPCGAGGAFPIGSATTINGLSGSIDDLVGPIDQLSGSFAQTDQLILGSDSPAKFYHVDASNTLGGTAITATLRRAGLDLDHPDRVKLVKAVWPKVNNGSVELRVGTQASSYEPIAWGPWVSAAADRVNVFAAGRYIAVEYRSLNGSQWRSGGFDLEYTLGGRY